MLDGGPGRLDPFRAIKRIFGGDTLSPSNHSVALDGEQQDAAAIETAEARLKKMDERHLDFAQGNGFNFHANLERVHPLFVPTAQQELTIPLMVPFVSQHRQVLGKCLQKILAVTVLDFLGTISRT